LKHSKTPFEADWPENSTSMALNTTKLHFFALYQQTKGMQQVKPEKFPMKSSTYIRFWMPQGGKNRSKLST
jgi:hypothetical protein